MAESDRRLRGGWAQVVACRPEPEPLPASYLHLLMQASYWFYARLALAGRAPSMVLGPLEAELE